MGSRPNELKFLFLVFVVLASLTPWLSFTPRNDIFKTLWSMQIANTYSPFTKSESLTESYFSIYQVYYHLEYANQPVYTVTQGKFLSSVSEPHTNKIVWRQAPYFSRDATRGGPLRRLARRLMTMALCKRTKQFLPLSPNAPVNAVRIEYVFGDHHSEELRLECGDNPA